MFDNKSILQQAVENLNSGDLGKYLELYDEHVILHGYPPDLPEGIEGARIFYGGMWNAFPHPKLLIEDIISEEEKVACRYTLRGVHKGEFMGVPPTNKEIALTGITILWFSNGKCVERWNQPDMLGLMHQLGVLPQG